MVLEWMMKNEFDLAEAKIKLKLKDQLAEFEGETESLEKTGFSKYDHLIKAISITSYLAAALTYFILLEIGYLGGS